jgi:hypothetical protein
MNLRRSILAILATAACGATVAQERMFEGAWGRPWCGNGTVECGGFYLYLVQRGSRICGNHFAATAGLGQLDEGVARSVVGTVVGNTAIVVATSGRSGASFLARAERSGSSLEWHLLEQLAKGAEGESALIPAKARLSLGKAAEALAQAESECEEHFANEL